MRIARLAAVPARVARLPQPHQLREHPAPRREQCLGQRDARRPEFLAAQRAAFAQQHHHARDALAVRRDVQRRIAFGLAFPPRPPVRERRVDDWPIRTRIKVQGVPLAPQPDKRAPVEQPGRDLFFAPRARRRTVPQRQHRRG